MDNWADSIYVRTNFISMMGIGSVGAFSSRWACTLKFRGHKVPVCDGIRSASVDKDIGCHRQLRWESTVKQFKVWGCDSRGSSIPRISLLEPIHGNRRVHSKRPASSHLSCFVRVGEAVSLTRTHNLTPHYSVSTVGRQCARTAPSGDGDLFKSIQHVLSVLRTQK